MDNVTNKIIAFAKKAMKPILAKLPDKGAKLQTGLTNSTTTGGSVALKGLGAIVVAHEADKIMDKTPIVKEVYNWWASFLDSLYDKSIYKIPGVGKFLKQVSDFAGKLIVPNAQKAIEESRSKKGQAHLNDPKWYVQNEMHTEFDIPFVYGDNLGLKFGNNIDVASICVLTLGYNPLADRYAVDSRLNQTLDLLKGIRGLSGRLPYTKGDLFYYDLITKYVINEYYKLKFSIRLSNYYSLNKSRMPKNIMQELGWDFDDFLEHKALYITLLTQLSNFITNTIPMFGVQLDKIKSMWECFVPDCNDGKVALYYKVYPVIDGYLPSVANNTISYERFGDKFFDFTPDKAANDDLAQAGRTYNMTYTTYAGNLLSFINKMNSNDIFTNIRADIIGAFGNSAIWIDKDINSCHTYDGILGKFDELYLTMIQNATILDEAPLYANTSGGVATARPNDIYYTAKFGGVSSVGTAEMPYQWVGAADNTYVGLDYQAQETGSTAGTFQFAATDGRASGWVGPNSGPITLTDNLSVLANKYKMTEGENLEILQFFAQEVGGNGFASLDTNTQTAHCKRHYMTNCFYVTNADILYHRNGVDDKVRLGSYVYVMDSSAAAITIANYANLCIQFWSQADYMSKLHICILQTPTANVSQRQNNMLLDYNIMGSISSQAFRQAIKYSTYSTYAANLKVTESRRVNNIVDIYNSK